ncbi:MAG: hypothetical protein R6V45_04060 [Oceanipulchritudo sp.]
MHKGLQEFIDAHGEYFDGPREALLIRRDLRKLFEEYSQAMDPEEYADLKQRVEDFREFEKKRLQEEVEALVRDREKEERVLQEIMGELDSFEKELLRLDKELEKLEREKKPLKGPGKRAWYHSGYIFLLLDFLGVFLLYIGIILNEKLTMSYVMLGMASIALGFILQGGAPRRESQSTPAVTGLRDDLLKRKNEVENFSKLKKMSLRNRKKIALGKINELNRQIEGNMTRINEYLRE